MKTSENVKRITKAAVKRTFVDFVIILFAAVIIGWAFETDTFLIFTLAVAGGAFLLARVCIETVGITLEAIIGVARSLEDHINEKSHRRR